MPNLEIQTVAYTLCIPNVCVTIGHWTIITNVIKCTSWFYIDQTKNKQNEIRLEIIYYKNVIIVVRIKRVITDESVTHENSTYISKALAKYK